uniref:CLIP domain-containing serine protease n=1 Tax=Diabrotica virgifera virgifera TaxID=50390 RepID=A0A6P7FRE5_DIAVI
MMNLVRSYTLKTLFFTERYYRYRQRPQYSYQSRRYYNYRQRPQYSYQSKRGTSCKTPNQEWATCNSIYSCRALLSAVQTRDPTQLKFLKESQCGYDSEPLVCCGSTSTFALTGRRVLNNDVTAVATGGSNSNYRVNSAIPDRPKCGQDFSDKIFGGTATKINEFPWMALLQYANPAGHRRWACAGSLINERYILTAAHCVTGDISRVVGKLVNVRLGEYNTESEVDCDGELCNDPQDIGVEEVLYNEGYNNNNVHRYNDIALIRLNRSVKFSRFIYPICLPHPNEAARVGDRVIVAGWGKTESSSRSNIKLKVEIPIAQRSQCTRAFASAGIILKNSQICAGGQRGRDSCAGDSGGPLMKTVEDDSSTWYQEGIVSFGARCGTEGWPGIYTKVENYLGWIHRNVRE